MRRAGKARDRGVLGESTVRERNAAGEDAAAFECQVICETGH